MNGLGATIRGADSRPASDDDLALWAASVWAMPEPLLMDLASTFEDALEEEEEEPTVRRLASLLLNAVECALVGIVPGVETMRAAGLAVAAIRAAGRE